MPPNMGKVHSALRQQLSAVVGNWHDQPWREKDSRAIATALAAGAIGAASAAFLYRALEVRDRLNDARALVEFAGGLGFLWYRTDPRMDERAPQLLQRVTREQHAASVRAFSERIRALAAAAAAVEAAAAAAAAAGASGRAHHTAGAVGSGHDKSNSFGRSTVRSMPHFQGSALVHLDVPARRAAASSGVGGGGGGGGGGSDGAEASEPTVAVEPGMSMDQLLMATLGRCVAAAAACTSGADAHPSCVHWRPNSLLGSPTQRLPFGHRDAVGSRRVPSPRLLTRCALQN